MTHEDAREQAWKTVMNESSHSLKSLTLEHIHIGNITFNRLLGNRDDAEENPPDHPQQ